jgi:hypothetical protein
LKPACTRGPILPVLWYGGGNGNREEEGFKVSWFRVSKKTAAGTFVHLKTLQP